MLVRLTFMSTLLLLLTATTSFAETVIAAQPIGKGIESEGYLWNSLDIEALELEGDTENGEVVYQQHCARCHGKTAAGSLDGSMPKIAGQHFTVTVKEVNDFLLGIRDGDINYAALSQALKDSQQLADVAEYVASMPRQLEAGYGPGNNLDIGKKLHEKDCAGCHRDDGRGSDENYYPVIAGQHFNYLHIQLRAMQLQNRRNAMPAMVNILKGYSGKQLIALADYLSRLDWPEKVEEW